MLSRRQVTVQRDNLISICRISVKCLLDYASLYTHVNDDCEEFINFCAVFEQLVSHRLKPNQKKTWLPGQGSPRHFWDVLVDNYHRTQGFLYQSCIPNIEAIETLKSPKAKLRAFIRVGLMEKRLSDYLTWVRDNKYVMRESYLEGAFMTSEEAAVLVGELVGLNAIDFNFCLKGNENELLGPLEINYSPFLVYKQSSASQCSDEIEMLHLSGKDVDELRHTSSILTESNLTDVLRVQNLEKDMRQIKEQKDYLEELLRLRERQLTEANMRIENANIEWQQTERRREQERLTMEACILELQQEMAKLQKSNDSLKAQLSASKVYKQRTEVKAGPKFETATSGDRQRNQSAMHVQMDSIWSRSSLPQMFGEQPPAAASAEHPTEADRFSSTITQETENQDVSEDHQTAVLLGTQSNPYIKETIDGQYKEKMFSSQSKGTLQAHGILQLEDNQVNLEHPLQPGVKEQVPQTATLEHHSELDAKVQGPQAAVLPRPKGLDSKPKVPNYEIQNSGAVLDKSESSVVSEQADSRHYKQSQERSIDSRAQTANHSNSNSLAAEHNNPILFNENSSSNAELAVELTQGSTSGSSTGESPFLEGREQSFPSADDDSNSSDVIKQQQEKQEQCRQEQEHLKQEQDVLAESVKAARVSSDGSHDT
ncbi:unnamed protein product [Candidula unifasciata]|uniref:RUN domain-containing protein n=1 Tax=Candidula unifasciata TaxID=100452 RepID=A0A8S3YR56_9EUPU|nr:unnamed protein product [Candidula unifasciata]